MSPESQSEQAEVDKFFSDFDNWADDYLKKSKNQYQELTAVINEFKAKQQSLDNLLNSSKKYLASYTKHYNLIKKNNKNLDNEKCENFLKKIKEIKSTNLDVVSILPKGPSWFLRKCIGNVNISLYWKKYNYKEEYEDFKMKANLIAIFLSFLFWFIFPFRICDHLLHAFALWYYSSLTIQEGILSLNGSKINFWWKTHHFLAIFYVALMFLWPYDESYADYRSSHYKLGFIQCISQLLQFQYQQIQLYRLKTMGTSGSMEVTSDWPKFKTWTTGFTLMVPILLTIYCYQYYISFYLLSLYYKYYHWQILLIGLHMVTFATGNTYTLLTVGYLKLLQ